MSLKKEVKKEIRKKVRKQVWGDKKEILKIIFISIAIAFLSNLFIYLTAK